MTPLHWACFQNSSISVHYLLAFGANVNSTCNLGKTPLHIAVHVSKRYQNEYIIAKLIMKGADRSVTDHKERKPIDLLDLNNKEVIMDAEENPSIADSL